jgi:glycosyltransferase involved in cell wall biosynthesis
MKKIKVLSCFLQKSGGVSEYQKNVARYIDRDRFTLDFVTLCSDLSIFTEIFDLGSKIYQITCFAEDNKEKFCDELTAIMKNGYDVVHLHTTFWQSFACEEAARKLRIPTIIIHGHSADVTPKPGITYEQQMAIHRKYREIISADYATHFCACSKTSAEFLYGDNIDKEKIIILNNSIDTLKFKFNSDKREQFRNELKLSDKFVIGHVGRFEWQKNHGFIIDLFKNISIEIKNAVLLLIGSTGSKEKYIHNLVHEAGLTEKIIFLGERNDVYNLYNAMDIFIMPSLREGFGIAAIEAQCSGLKTLLSDKVPETAAITDITERLPLDLKLWREKTLETYSNGYDRKDCSAIIREAGFDMADSVKTLERIYSGEI